MSYLSVVRMRLPLGILELLLFLLVLALPFCDLLVNLLLLLVQTCCSVSLLCVYV